MILDASFPSLWQLRVFEAVARLENVCRASQELLRSQPAVAACIAKLEELFDVSLFDRSTTGTYPTAAGVAVLVRTRHILSLAAQALTDVCGLTRDVAVAAAPRITRTQMRALITIAEAKSFKGAARLTGISEASLQRAARQFERDVGCPLYRHTVNAVTTTPTGTALAKRMQMVVAHIEALTSYVRHYATPRENCLSIGVLLLDPTILLTNAIREFRAAFPHTRVSLVSGSYDLLRRKLNAGNIDFIIGILKHPDGASDLREEWLYYDKYAVVARRGHKLAGQPSVGVEQLRQYGWILPQHGSPRRIAFEQIFFDGPPPNAGIETYSLSTIRIALAESDMLSVLSRTEMLSEQRIGLLETLDFNVPGKGAAVGFTMHADWHPDEAHIAFMKAFRHYAERLGLRTVDAKNDMAHNVHSAFAQG